MLLIPTGEVCTERGGNIENRGWCPEESVRGREERARREGEEEEDDRAREGRRRRGRTRSARAGLDDAAGVRGSSARARGTNELRRRSERERERERERGTHPARTSTSTFFLTSAFFIMCCWRLAGSCCACWRMLWNAGSAMICCTSGSRIARAYACSSDSPARADAMFCVTLANCCVISLVCACAVSFSAACERARGTRSQRDGPSGRWGSRKRRGTHKLDCCEGLVELLHGEQDVRLADVALDCEARVRERGRAGEESARRP